MSFHKQTVIYQCVQNDIYTNINYMPIYTIPIEIFQAILVWCQYVPKIISGNGFWTHINTTKVFLIALPRRLRLQE